MNKYKIRILQFLFLLTSILGIAHFGPYSLIVSLLAYFLLEVFVGNATLHRYYGHQAFEMTPWKRNTLTWLAHHIGVGSVLGWTGHHRWHHKYSDSPMDLHSPTANGIFHILFGIWGANIPRSMIKDLLFRKDLLWWHRNYFRYHTFLFLLLLLISPWALVFVYAVPNFLCLCSGYVIAILPHSSGTVKNSLTTELLTFGEGWHAYHHENPSQYRFNRFDFTAWVIDVFLKTKNPKF